jgi:hypothetical protein
MIENDLYLSDPILEDRCSFAAINMTPGSSCHYSITYESATDLISLEKVTSSFSSIKDTDVT